MKADIIVNTLRALAKKKKVIIRPMKLQKLLYFSHGRYSVNHKEKLIDEPFQAWPYGPVIPDVYTAYKKYRSNPIEPVSIPIIDKKAKDDSVIDTINKVLDDYGEYTDMTLSEISHYPEGAWIKAYTRKSFSEIDQKEIEIEFQKELDAEKSSDRERATADLIKFNDNIVYR